MTQEEKAKAYDKAIDAIRKMMPNWEKLSYTGKTFLQDLKYIIPELKESDDERIRKSIIRLLQVGGYMSDEDKAKAFAWLEKQGEQKEINLVEILKHYPKETELYSPLYGKLWFAEVDEKNEIITCYKHHLEEGCTRAVLEQEDTVSFYSNGTTGLPDFSVSKDCMLFLYDIEKQGEHYMGISEVTKQELKDNLNKALAVETSESWNEFLDEGEQKPAEWSEEDEKHIDSLLERLKGLCRNEFKRTRFAINEDEDWLKSLKDRVQPKQEWGKEDNDKIYQILAIIDDYRRFYTIKPSLRKALLKDLNNIEVWLKSLRPHPKNTISKEFEDTVREIKTHIAQCKGFNREHREEVFSLLDSLRPQNHWKPSEEMLEALGRAIPENVMEISEDEMLLNKLYQGLKYGRVLSKN